MPKTPSVILRDKMSRHGFELLDIYHVKQGDLIRFKDKTTGVVRVVRIEKHVRDFVDEKDYEELIKKIMESSK